MKPITEYTSTQFKLPSELARREDMTWTQGNVEALSEVIKGFRS